MYIYAKPFTDGYIVYFANYECLELQDTHLDNNITPCFCYFDLTLNINIQEIKIFLFKK